jgi:hypothetical protein
MADNAARRAKFYARKAELDAERQGLTPEEYGVYKGSVGSTVQPVNSASGLLIMSIVLTLISIGVAYGAVIIVMQSMGLVPVMWFFFFLMFLAPVASWSYYIKERRAQKLRLARGLPRNITESGPSA